MMNIKKISSSIFLVTIYSMIILNVLANTFVFGNNINTTIVITCIILSIISIISILTNKKLLTKIMFTLAIMYFICVIGYITLYNLDIINILSSPELLKNYIISTNEKGIFIYILIQVLQVVFVPIPAAVIAIVGSLIYGPVLGAVYCTIGILLGSYISYFMGKTLGFRLVSWLVGPSNASKYADILCKRGSFFLAIAFLLPLFPDDILCLIAGISTMKFSTFFIVTSITRPIGVIFMCVFGSGHIIPYSGWGLVVWGIIILFAVSMVFIIYKYQEKLQRYIFNKLKLNIKN